jgi:hypothetical protein
MKKELVFLLEDLSMKNFLAELFKRSFPNLVAEQHYRLIPHDGFKDLTLSIPRKLKAWKKANFD